MSNYIKRSWADIVGGRQAKPKAGQEFVWRAGRNGRTKVLMKPGCNGQHCELEENSCKQPECKTMLLGRLGEVISSNALTTSSITAVHGELEKLRAAIFEHCKTDGFSSDDMEVTRKAVVKANHKKIDPEFCECTSCQLQYHQREAEVLHERLSAARSRLEALKEYRLANDEDTLYRTSSKSTSGGKYFTPVGSTKAKGVATLRPTLQMQNSYDVTDLRTNSMIARPLKVAWKDKPRTLRITDVDGK